MIIFYFDFFQLCSASGNLCIQTTIDNIINSTISLPDHYKCLPLCVGIYAPVTRKPSFTKDPDLELVQQMKAYLKLDNELLMSDFARNKLLIMTDFFENTHDEDAQINDLKILTITFNSPLLLHITRDVKINFVGKLSSIGGAFGLFSGFSIMSFIEIIYWINKFIFSFFKHSSCIQGLTRKRSKSI